MSTDVRTARHGAEDGFHEIQLSGKQLVFLFMATTIVSIVIFLCGVLVGRGARVEAPADVVDASAPAELPGQLQAASGAPVVNSSAPPAPAAAAEPGKPTKVDNTDFNYMEMLTAEQRKDEVPQPPAEPVAESAAASATTPLPGGKPEVAAPPSKPVEAAPPKTAAAPAPAPAAPAAAVAAPAASGDLTVQVAAVKERSEADRIVKRLQGKGYQAYVADPAPGTAMYRVRVGHYSDRAEASKTASRLAKEEKFRPWVTR